MPASPARGKPVAGQIPGSGRTHFCRACARQGMAWGIAWDSISAGVVLPGAVRSRAAWLASFCSAAFTGVGTPCCRPSSTISPFRKSASIVPVPRLKLCHDEPPARDEPFTAPVRT